MKRLLAWLRGERATGPARARAGLLRQLVLDRGLGPSLERDLRDAAVLVHKAGLQHLVTEATLAEVRAMAEAGDLLEEERRLRLVHAVLEPGEAFRKVDGGRLQRSIMKSVATGEALRGG